MYSLTQVSNMFKTKFGPLSDATYNSATVLLARVKKNYNMVGDQTTFPVPNKFGGGVGSGSLPSPNASNTLKATLTAKKVYAVVQVDRESIKASQNEEGAYAKMLKWAAERGTESYMRNMSRILFGDGTGTLGVSTAADATGTAAAPVITISAATWNEANWEEGDFVNMSADLASQFEVTAVDPVNLLITLARNEGSYDATADATAKTVYMQNSANNDPQGLKGACDAASGPLYGITIQRRFQAYQKAAGAAAISESLMNKAMLEIERKTGKVPNLIVTSYIQLGKLLDLFTIAGVKRIDLEPRDQRLVGKVGLNAIAFQSNNGKSVAIVADRFCQQDRMYFLNDDQIEIHHRPDFGWFDDDGTVFLRDSDSDSYSARYGGYLEVFINVAFQGVITGLSVS